MKKQTVSLLVLLLAASGFFFSCGNTMNKNAGALEFDSIQVNETAHLFGDTAKPQIVTYLDGPFYPDAELPAKLQKTQLRDQVYEAMGKRAQNSNMEMIRYIKKDTDREKSFI